MVRYQVPLLHFLRHRGAAEAAEDLVQDTMLRAYENLQRYRPRWQFSTWLFTIARRLNINHHRRRRIVWDNEASLDAVATGQAGPERVAMETERRERLWAVAREVLSEDQHTAMWLHYVEDMPVAQIARVLDRSPASVKAIMFRARKKLLPRVRDLDDARLEFPETEGVSYV